MNDLLLERNSPNPNCWRELFYRQYEPTTKGDDSESRKPYLTRFIKRHVPPDRASKIADLGCGKATLLRILRQCGYENLTGVDLSPSQIETARNLKVAHIEESDCLSFLKRSEPGRFDVVISFDVIEHLTRYELMLLGSEVLRTLRPGGRWLIHAPNAAGIFGNRVRYADATHEQAFTPESICQWAQSLGFQSAACYEDKPVIHGIASFFRSLLWSLIRTAAALCIAAETGQTRDVVLSQNLVAVLVK